MGPALTGWVVSSALLGSLFGALGAGPAADRIGRRKIIGVAAFIFSLGIVGAALSPDVATPIPSRLVLGVAVGIADRKSVASGKSVSGRVDSGWRRGNNKKNEQTKI